MTKHHYVYYSYEEWGRDYIGVRSCNCLPEEDTKYFGSFRDKTFKPTGKTILFVCETRKEASEIEIELHDFFDVAVNPQFVNRSKQTNAGFDRAGVAHTEETKKKQSAAKTGEKNPCYDRTGEKNPMFGMSGALHHRSNAIIAIKPDGTQEHYGSIAEAAKEVGINRCHLCGYSKSGKVMTKGKFKGWQFIYENSEVLI